MDYNSRFWRTVRLIPLPVRVVIGWTMLPMLAAMIIATCFASAAVFFWRECRDEFSDCWVAYIRARKGE